MTTFPQPPAMKDEELEKRAEEHAAKQVTPAIFAVPCDSAWRLHARLNFLAGARAQAELLAARVDKSPEGFDVEERSISFILEESPSEIDVTHAYSYKRGVEDYRAFLRERAADGFDLEDRANKHQEVSWRVLTETTNEADTLHYCEPRIRFEVVEAYRYGTEAMAEYCGARKAELVAERDAERKRAEAAETHMKEAATIIEKKDREISALRQTQETARERAEAADARVKRLTEALEQIEMQAEMCDNPWASQYAREALKNERD